MARAPELAFQDDSALLTPGAVRDRLIRSMVRQHAKAVRLNVIYGKVKQQGYGQLDETVNYLRAHGIRPQMTVMANPAYMSGVPNELSNRNTNPGLMGQFAGEVAKHFAGRVGRYSIGNEPNLPTFLNVANPYEAGRVYRGIFRAGRAAVKRVDPAAQVMFGELMPGATAPEFLRGAFAGKPLRASGFAFHPYALGDKQRGAGWDINNLQALQDTLAAYKRRGKFQTARGGQVPLYLTEFGEHKGRHTPAERLRFFEQGYAKAKAAHARQLLQYQMVPTANRTPGQWAWDTSIGDAQGNVPVINRGLRLRRR